MRPATVYAEASGQRHQTIENIRAVGFGAGVFLNPATSPEAVEEILTEVALVLMMTVDRSFGDQELNLSTLDKVRRAAGLPAGRSLPVQTSRPTGASTNRPSLFRSTPG
ncbi:hypothetical protein ITP53_24655 [Nonomuraea sp. K274]|uniref:Uncharacterized protein n=1 Tax=Nonomuraea cypriaca TaxID=1187855 RepID=A0A931AGR8_9ACTN|nr:hypothetical protein [Nonomuraea cypriaca]MBF8188867.1 hypothetical protein [Nonomuraea cypriaca]